MQTEIETYETIQRLRRKEKWLTFLVAASLLAAVGVGSYGYFVGIFNLMP